MPADSGCENHGVAVSPILRVSNYRPTVVVELFGVPMRACERISLGLMVRALTCAVAQNPPSGFGVLPPPRNDGVVDLTPPEFLKPPPPGLIEQSPSGGWNAGIEFLYVTPRERGLDFAIVDPRDDLVPAGSIQSLYYQPTLAVRAGIAYQIPERHWDIGFAYTHIGATDEFGTAAGPGGLLYATLTRSGLTNEAQLAAARTRLTMDLYDVLAGRTWDLDESARVRLFGGGRLATVQQGMLATYYGREADAAAAELRWRFEGYGPLLAQRECSPSRTESACSRARRQAS